MVMALVSELGKIRPVCLSRFYLRRAHEALERDDRIAAGCLLREAVQRYLWALCQYHDVCVKSEPIHRTPARLLKELYKAKQFESCGYEWVKDSIDVGNKLAHCRPVRTSLVECCIDLMHGLMDYSPEIIFPTRDGGDV